MKLCISGGSASAAGCLYSQEAINDPTPEGSGADASADAPMQRPLLKGMLVQAAQSWSSQKWKRGEGEHIAV